MDSPESEHDASPSLNQSQPCATQVKSEHEKSKETIELLDFFNRLPDGACDELLDQLCLLKDSNKLFCKPTNLKAPSAMADKSDDNPKNLEEAYSAMENKSKAKKARLYDEFLETQRKKKPPRSTVAAFALINSSRAFKLLLPLATNAIVVKFGSFFASKIAVMILSLAKKHAIRLSNCLRQK